jgi:hypothetical protein
MGVFTNIEAALHTRLATLSGSPAVAWPNTHYQPTENTTYIRPTILPANTILNTLAGMEEHKGIYQVDVYVPLEKGVSALNTLLDSIQSLFKSSKTLTATDIIFIQAVSRSPAVRDESWYVGFVEINYICYS